MAGSSSEVNNYRKRSWKGFQKVIQSICVPLRQDYVCVIADSSLFNLFQEIFSGKASAVFPGTVSFKEMHLMHLKINRNRNCNSRSLKYCSQQSNQIGSFTKQCLISLPNDGLKKVSLALIGVECHLLMHLQALGNVDLYNLQLVYSIKIR